MQFSIHLWTEYLKRSYKKREGKKQIKLIYMNEEISIWFIITIVIRIYESMRPIFQHLFKVIVNNRFLNSLVFFQFSKKKPKIKHIKSCIESWIPIILTRVPRYEIPHIAYFFKRIYTWNLIFIKISRYLIKYSLQLCRCEEYIYRSSSRVNVENLRLNSMSTLKVCFYYKIQYF